jgi:flagellar biosynthetic protein FliR
MDFDFTNALFVFLRASGLMLLFPLFSGPNVPVQIRVALAAFLTLLVSPVLPPFPLPLDSVPGTVLLMSREILAGLFLGFITRMVFYAVDLAGGLLSAEIGLSLPASMNPLGSGGQTQIGLMLYFLAGFLWFCLDMHHVVVIAFERTYRFLPLGTAHVTEPLALDLINRTSHLFVFGLLMAAPALATSFIIMLVFSVLGRAIPQMNVFTESFAIRILAGLAVIGMTCDLMATHIANGLRRLPDDLLRVAQLMGVG